MDLFPVNGNKKMGTIKQWRFHIQCGKFKVFKTGAIYCACRLFTVANSDVSKVV